jgi:hypothetical protein
MCEHLAPAGLTAERWRRAARVRLQKTDIVGGVSGAVARDVVRKYRGNRSVAEAAADILMAAGDTDVHGVFAQLQAAGYLEVDSVDDDGDTWSQTSIQCNALAMAGFGKPITRKTADRLVAGVLERARSYNADPTKPLAIAQLRVFGSYLDPQVDPLGNVDIELLTARRPGYDPFAYGKASGRNFNTFMDHVLWAHAEVARHLANRSAAINITPNVGAQARVIYAIADDPSARPMNLPPEQGFTE